jgi:hypothetical protein
MLHIKLDSAAIFSYSVAYLGFVKGGGPMHVLPLPSPLAHTPPSPPSPLFPCPSLPPVYPSPPFLSSPPFPSPFNGGPEYNPREKNF